MSLNRFLKLAEIYYEHNEFDSLRKLCSYFGSVLRKEAKVPDFFKKNMDYDSKEDSPYFGSVSEFLKKYPGGIMEWLEKKNQKKIKTAFIRTDKSGEKQGCPFGLPIATACKNAGSSVSRMCPLDIIEGEEKEKKVKKANQRIYLYFKEDCRCSYAKNIMENKEVVNCDFGDTGQGMGIPAFSGSPIYPQAFAGVTGGVSAFPLGFYADNSESRNLFQGLFSLVGKTSFDIVKKSILENKDCIEIIGKLEKGKELTEEERNIVKSLIGGK